MTTSETTDGTAQKSNIAIMNANELEQYTKALEKKHKAGLRTLRALMRARKAEEEATEQTKGTKPA